MPLTRNDKEIRNFHFEPTILFGPNFKLHYSQFQLMLVQNKSAIVYPLMAHILHFSEQCL